MASSFLGLYVQRDALLLAQKALDITGNNISNIDTKGYSRQRVDIVSVSHARNTLGYNTSVSLAGQGAEALGITQIRDKLLDKKVRNYSGDLCDVGVKCNTLGDIEDIFDSIEADSAEVEASFAAVVNKLKAALQSYTADNADRAEMGNIAMNTAEGLAQALRRYSLDLDKIADETIMDAQKTTDRINEIFAEMGNLNKQIKDSYISMGYIESDTHNYQVQSEYGPLELKDEMNNLLDELAQYGNIEFQEEWDGTFSVKFADQLVVSGKYYAQMATTELDPRPTELGFIITQTDLKDAWTPKTDDRGVPTKGLYDKDTWYDMNIAESTAGDYQLLVRKLSNETDPNKKVDVMDVTGKTPNGSQYLDTGSLRGLLDMYNGRGLFATDTVDEYGNVGEKDAAIQNDVKTANDALAQLQQLISNHKNNAIDDVKYNAQLNEIADILNDSIGAKLKVADDGSKDVTVEVGNGYQIFKYDCDPEDPNDLSNYTEFDVKKLEAKNPDDPYDYDNVAIKADGETVRTIALNTYSGIEYYRDLLNSFAATLADKFNDVYINAVPHTVTINNGNNEVVLLDKNGNIPTLNVDSVGGKFNLVDGKGNIIKTYDDKAEADKALKDLNEALIGIKDSDRTEPGQVDKDQLNTFEQTIRDILGDDVQINGDIKLYDYGNDFRHAAENLRISQQWLDNPELVSDPTGGDNKYEELDNTYIHKLLALFSNDITYSDGMGHNIPTSRPLDKFVSYINEQVGTQKGSEDGVYNATDIMLETVETARSEAMDVSMNEEGVNMMNYQKWYNAISRMVSTLDEALDKLINNTGLVGLR